MSPHDRSQADPDATGSAARAASVVVPTRGGRGRLDVLLGCLEAQDTDDFEVVVVVDGDIDGSAPFLAARPSPLTVACLTFPENRGRSAALNTGLAAARGRVLIRCDDDLEPAPDYVSGHVRAHEGRQVGAVGLYRNVFPDTPYAVTYGRTADERFRDEAYAGRPDRVWRYWAGNV
ncbi:MAG TPA: glycosyltransferase, partial [Ornithinibacter sp.]|nr:glycosyltransferase [Ornithinibacter sp.]